MKVKIEINAKAMFCEYASKKVIREYIDENYEEILNDGISYDEIYDKENEGIWSSIDYDYFYIMSDIEVLANGDDITKKKGKYIIVDDLVHSELCTSDMPYPIEFRPIRSVGYYGWVELDVEEFDPKKLHMRKSTYEHDEIPYAIDAMFIVYDDKLIELDTESMCDYYDRWGYGKDQAFIIDK